MAASSRRPTSPKDELLPLSDALTELGITRATWYRWRNRGYGPEAKRTPTGRICVRRSALNAFLDEMDAA
ncbi:helix-turn-helix transcriptional regulator [Streptomyces sp. NPDC001536]|uniref:helix-turn-helix transcriptional regulator n=1 Tax=Streptomyces sp. NPDC001536 TaxID=3364583 RepID=UPI003698E7BB